MSDDWVYLTSGGGRWHQREDCEALAKGQQDASDRGLTNHPISRVPSTQVAGRVACGWCVALGKSQTSALADPALRQLRTDTEYERLFLDHVLGSLPELWDWTIESQKVITVAARSYRVDFAVTSGPDRVAIEVDGEHKGDNAPSHDEWTRRQTALVSDGWEVLRFTNRQVRDEQEACRRDLAVTVARLRERRRQVSSALPVPRPASEPSPLPDSQRSAKSWFWAALIVVIALVAWFAWNQSNGTTQPPDSPSQPNATTEVGGVPPEKQANGFLRCPASHQLKGNVNETTGEKIVHSPGGAFYDTVKPERCFASVDDARSEGYRASER